jgi:hypothetical protein
MAKSKKNEQSGVVPISEMDIDFIYQQERKKTRTEFARLQEQAKKIDNLHERLVFWSNQQKEYKMRVFNDDELLAVSGVVSYQRGGLRLWMDYLISCEIDDLSTQIRNAPPNPEDSKKGVKEILLLHELGVIEFLYKRFGTYIPDHLASILPDFINVTEINAKKVLQRLANKFYKPERLRAVRKSIRQQYGEIKPLTSIKFEKELE